jgi:cytochrome c553
MKTLIKIVTCLALVFFSLLSHFSFAADIKAGEKKAQLCVSCHGEKGISSNASQYPSLAGQHALYLSNQLNYFKSGARVNQTMQGMAGVLTAADIENLAAYFASLPNKNINTNAKTPADGSSKFAMCAGCHGSSAEGRSGFPRLAGQNPDYLVAQLHNFKKGIRKGGPMSAMAANLSEEDIKTLSVYLSTLKPAKE